MPTTSDPFFGGTFFGGGFFAAVGVAPAPSSSSGGGGGTSSRKRQVRAPRYVYEPEEVREVVKTIGKVRRLPETLDPGDVVQIAEQVSLLSSVGQWDINAALRDLRTLELVAPVIWRPQVAAIRAALEDDEEALLLLL
jgi:hypothetical protein